jgi:hypothetical protein
MNSADLSNFFYNLIPGSIFLIGLHLLEIPFIPNIIFNKKGDIDSSIFILYFIIAALFIGFFLQGCVKILRDLILNRMCFWYVVHNNPDQYNYSLSLLKAKGKKIPAKDKKDAFYLMDNFIRGNDKAFNAMHFSSRFALWSNICLASTIYIFISLFYLGLNSTGPIIFASILLFIFSLLQSVLHFYAYYDVVLKTFIITNE